MEISEIVEVEFRSIFRPKMSAVTDISFQDEEVLNQLFDSVDICITGFVSSNSLVEAVENTWANASDCSEREVKVHVQDLVRRLDGRNDNGYVSREVFVKCGLDWLSSVRVRTLENF